MKLKDDPRPEAEARAASLLGMDLSDFRRRRDVLRQQAEAFLHEPCSTMGGTAVVKKAS